MSEFQKPTLEAAEWVWALPADTRREQKTQADDTSSFSTCGAWSIPTRTEIRNIIVQCGAQHVHTAQPHSPSPSGLSSRGASRSLKWKLAIMSRTASISLFKPWLWFRPPATPSSGLSPSMV